MDTEYLTVPFELVKLKASDGGHKFTGYASTSATSTRAVTSSCAAPSMRRSVNVRGGHCCGSTTSREPIGVEKSLKADDRGLLERLEARRRTSRGGGA